MWWPRWALSSRSNGPRQREASEHAQAGVRAAGRRTLGLVPAPHVATRALGLVQSQVRRLIKTVQRRAMVREHGHADTRTALHFGAIDRHRSLEALNDAVTD